MKKKIINAIVVAIAVVTSANASQINWANDPEVYDWSGAGNLVLGTYSSYVVRLYESVDATINFGVVGGVATNTADDTWTGLQFNWNDGGGDNGFAAAELLASDSSYGVNEGDKVYSVIFSTGGSYFAIIDSSLAAVSYPGAQMTYNPGGIVGGLQGAGGDWQQVVPEPATFLLFGIGGMGAWLVRRRNRLTV
jgi:hypothetical protein